MPENLTDFTEKEELRQVIRRLQGEVAKSKAKTDDLVQAVYRAAHDVSLTLGPAPAIPIPSKDKRRSGEEVALVHFTDPQYGKKTESYDMETCERRVELLAEKIIRLTDIQRADHPVKKVGLMLGGDFTEGMHIFPGQVYELDGYLFEQIFGIARITENLVRNLLANFEEVEVWEEDGNHGRPGRKGEDPRTDNNDLIAYNIARLALKGEKRLTWNRRQSWYQQVQIGNYKAVLIHGDEIKSFGGNTPAFGLLRKGTAWASGVMESFQDIYFGHFHTHMTLTLPNGGHMYGTGSTESGNAYAAEFVAAKGRPSQRLHFIEPEKGLVTAEFQVYLA